jgi:hypothetical protein
MLDQTGYSRASREHRETNERIELMELVSAARLRGAPAEAVARGFVDQLSLLSERTRIRKPRGARLADDDACR